MLKRCLALILSLMMIHNMSLTVQAMEDRPYLPALLAEISKELDSIGSSFLLVEENPSGQVHRIALSELESAFLRGGNLFVSYRLDGILREGRYLEPDRMKYVHEAITPKSKDALSEGNDIGLNRLRELVRDKAGAVVVAVLDTGIDSEHPWFRGRLFSPYDMVERDSVPQDLTGHGTHVCGIVAANTPPQVKIMPVRVFGDHGGASDFMIVKGIEYAVKNGADIINLSLGGYGTTSYLEKAIDYAYSKGVMVVTSAGNQASDLSNEYPAAFPEVITVGATGRDGDLLYYSNTGKELDVCAPGEKIESAALGGGTQVKSGTSMAAPLVTAATAMLMLEDPSRSVHDLETLLKAHTRDMGVTGRDPVFGFGELAFSQYHAQPDFYLVTSPRAAGQEEKFSMNLTMHVSDRVSKMHILIDGSLQQTSMVSKPGRADVALNIRAFKPGVHTLEIRPVLKDGSAITPLVKTITIPDYNLRIALYDIFDQPVRSAEIAVIGNAMGSRDKIETPAIMQNGIWMANLDFQQLAGRYDKVICAVSSYPGGTSDYALYMRIAAVSGQKVYETSECSVLSVTSSKEDIRQGCTAVTRMLGPAFSGFDTETIWRSNPNVYAIETGETFIRTVSYDDAGGSVSSGLLFYDVADLWLEIYAGPHMRQGDYPEAWQFMGFMRDIGEDEDMNVSQNPGLILDTDSQVSYPVVFSLRDITNDKRLFGDFTPDSRRRVFPPGLYQFQAEPRRTLADGRIAWDFYSGGLELTEYEDRVYRFGGGLSDEVRTDAAAGMILHQWRDVNGLSYQVMTERTAGSGTYQAHIPRLILTDTDGKAYTLDGTEVKDARDGFEHGFLLKDIPDGTYTVGFLYDASVTAYPVKPVNKRVTLKGGTVVEPNNSPPVAVSDHLAYLEPGSLYIRDLAEVFIDLDQESLRFMSNKGWILNGTFYYRDLLHSEETIDLKAYDPSGFSAVSTHRIRITNKMAAEPEYRPIPEIDSMGTSSWATGIVADAITWDIVPVELLDLYQTTITREEFSELIVKAVERLRGPVQIAEDKSFLDTRSEAVLKAASLGLLSGYKGVFSPREELSRQQLCVILYQTIKTLAPGKAAMVIKGPSFTDAGKIAPWAKEAVTFCHARGIIVGSGGEANPTGNLSREQAIIMVYKTFSYLR